MSLSPNTSWENIYREVPINNPYAIVKIKKNHQSEWNDIIGMSDFLEKLSLKVDKENITMIKCLGTLLHYTESLDDTYNLMMNLNSLKVDKSEYINECIKYLRKNTDMRDYHVFNFAFYMYLYKYYKNKTDFSDIDNILSSKIKLFEKYPEAFGYGFLREKFKNINNISDNVNKMVILIAMFYEELYPKYVDINNYTSKSGAKKIDFEYVDKELNYIYSFIKKHLDWLLHNFESDYKFDLYYLYDQYKQVLCSFKYLLEKDININKKLIDKVNGKKYGYFEYRKDCKSRNADNDRLYPEIVKLSDMIKKSGLL